MRAGSDALEQLLDLPLAQRRALIESLSSSDRSRLLFLWEFWARPAQLWRPGNERDTWYLAGRGWGKTRTGAEAVRWAAEHVDELGGAEAAIAGRTAGHRNRDMLYGTSGLLGGAVIPPWVEVEHRKSDGEIVWYRGRGEVGGRHYRGRRTRYRARLMSGDVPTSFRGPGFVLAWTDEFPHWRYPADCWSNLELTMREGDAPRTVNTTTPLATRALLAAAFELDEAGRPIPDPDHPTRFRPLPHVRIVVGSTYDNRANLAPSFLATTVDRYAGTRLGQQEIDAAILLDEPGALWRSDWFRRLDDAPELGDRIVAVDPAGSRGSDSAHTGIIAAGLDAHSPRLAYLLDDRSGEWSPGEWARMAIELADEVGAERIVAERNYGGDMVRSQILLVQALPEVVAERRARGHSRPVEVVDLVAQGSKDERARVARGLWEQGRVIHVGPSRRWLDLEHQMTHHNPAQPRRGQRLDRLDAAVHAVRFLVPTDPVERASLDDWEAAADPSYWRRVREGMLGR